MQERRKLLLIMNPRSGVMLAPKYLSEIVERFSKAGYLTQIRNSREVFESGISDPDTDDFRKR